ncbi:MAG: hypothetical protein ACOC7T_02055 [Planctomycetota bacterium]
MKKFKPLNLLNDKGFWPDKVAIADAIKEILIIGRCRKPMSVQDFGQYRSQEWRDEDDDLVPYQSVDWYVFDALNEDRMQVDCERILRDFSEEPWRKDSSLGDHYDLFVMEEDMFDPGEAEAEGGPGYTVGKSEKLRAAVISTHRIEHIWGLPYSYLKTEVMRQLCFMFGVPDPEREDVVVEGDSARCTQVCILRPARVAPDDWERLTEDRLKQGALCESCARGLQRFFQQAAYESS